MTNKKILLINGHPDAKSFNQALAEAYKIGVKASGSALQEIQIRDLNFNPNLEFSNRERTELEPDLIEAQKLTEWANHLVWIYPV